MRLRAFIVIRNGRQMRLVTRRPALAPNEVAVEVIINTPTTPQIVGSVTIDLPTPPPATAEVGTVEYPDPENYGDEETYREEGE